VQRVTRVALVEDDLVAAEVAVTQPPADIGQDALRAGRKQGTSTQR
jgi:hypothetical protein